MWSPPIGPVLSLVLSYFNPKSSPNNIWWTVIFDVYFKGEKKEEAIHPSFLQSFNKYLWRASSSFPGGSVSKEPDCNTGDLGLIPESGRSPGEGNGDPLQYSCLENSMDRGAWGVTVHSVIKSLTQLKWLSMQAQQRHRHKGQACGHREEKERVGWIERVALKHIHYHM